MIAPEKVTTSTLNPQTNIDNVRVSLVKHCMVTLAILCQRSEKARNFITTSHNSFLTVNKVYHKFGMDVKSVFVTTLFSFMSHPIQFHDQFVKIIRKIILLISESNT